jgi:hypothetical protein
LNPLLYFSDYNNLKQLCSSKVLQQQSVGATDQACRVTEHQSLINRLQELPVKDQVKKTLAVHCHFDFSVVLAGILQGIERPGSV